VSVFYRAFLELKGEKISEIDGREIDHSPMKKLEADSLNKLCERIENDYPDVNKLDEILDARFTQIFKDDTEWGSKQSYEEAVDVTPKIIDLLRVRRNAKQKSKRTQKKQA